VFGTENSAKEVSKMKNRVAGIIALVLLLAFVVGCPKGVEPIPGTTPGPASEAILATVDSIDYRFVRMEEGYYGEPAIYFFEIEASGTATAPVGYQLIVSQQGIWGNLTGSSWTPTHNMLKRDTGQPESITWNDTWQIFLDGDMFDGYYNLIKVEAQIYYQPTGWYSQKDEKQILIPHP